MSVSSHRSSSYDHLADEAALLAGASYPEGTVFDFKAMVEINHSGNGAVEEKAHWRRGRAIGYYALGTCLHVSLREINPDDESLGSRVDFNIAAAVRAEDLFATPAVQQLHLPGTLPLQLLRHQLPTPPSNSQPVAEQSEQQLPLPGIE